MGELYFYRHLKEPGEDEEDAIERFFDFVDAHSEETKEIMYGSMSKLDWYWKLNVAELTLEILDELEAFRDRWLHEIAYANERISDPIHPDKFGHVLHFISNSKLTDRMKKILNDLREDIFTVLCYVIEAENNLCLEEAAYIHKDEEQKTV